MSTAPEVALRDAASVILVRRRAGVAHVLIGQRGRTAAFLPSKFVFPGGAVDPGDAGIDLTGDLSRACLSRLKRGARPGLAAQLIAAAIRETWEETGLRLARADDAAAAGIGAVPAAPRVHPSWQGFDTGGIRPSAAGFSFVFRAITPPGRPRRFDARFFMVDCAHVMGDLDDFSGACDELSHLQWVPLEAVRSFDLPFITELVLAEVQGLLAENVTQPPSVPFMSHDGSTSGFSRLV
ncbi:DNA mismatch repair protein MutT [Brevirhabdus sp.]|uniref:DNA mismatch repair protein MutT n=1 Tax=Brevirhabdus sp. TaxID=2004514 RepID=UPI004058DA3A